MLRCAGQIPPPGGPTDMVPPAIIRTIPDTNAVRVMPDRIELEFSEYVDRQSVEESIFISPHVGQLEFDWSGSEVMVLFPEDLREGITYVLTVGTDVVDVRAGNRMSAAFSLAFSTGDSIDQGRISGRVFDREPEGLMVFAYHLGARGADSLDPTRVKPDYVTQTGRGGAFTLPNIAFGIYRVFAIGDEYRNLVYDRGIDRYGVATFDPFVHAGTPHASRVLFRITMEDTTRPFLSSVTALDRYNLRLQFSEPIDTASFFHAVVTVEDTSARERLGVEVLYLNRRNRARAGVVLRQPLEEDRHYRVIVGDVADEVGNPLDTANATFDIAGTDKPDTTRPFPVVVGVPDSTLGIPMEQVFELDFSEPVIQGSVTSAVFLEDADSVRQRVEFDWLNGRSLRVTPAEPLKERTWYVIRVLLDSISDFQGNTNTDSVIAVRFETLDLRTTGSVSGIVSDAGQSLEHGPIYVSATRKDDSGVPPTTVKLDSTGPFQIGRLIEGIYLIGAFVDADTSGSYTYGVPFPFAHAERFAVFEDSLRVRARWPYEGVLLRFE
ncbi:MAG: Ig-like domain-containing protein [Bacteroidota bacterium]